MSFDLSVVQWVFLFLGSFLTGVARTGIFGVMLLVVPLLSLKMPGKEAAGLILPLMVAGDFVAAYVYRKSFVKKAVFQILPWLVLGVAIGTIVGGIVSNELFNNLMAGMTFTCAAFVVWNEYRKGDPVRLKLWFIILIGLLSGFASMIGNASGPVITVYFIALNLKKREYVSSVVWLFWIVNIIKLPFHVFAWHTVDFNVLKLDLLLCPALILGLISGVSLIRKIPEKPFRVVIFISILLAGGLLLIQ